MERSTVLLFSRFMGYFTEVSRLGSIRKASEQLNVSASAIDRQILRAEEELGMPLFERLPTGLRPTAAGELLLNCTGRWTKDFERVQAQMADLLGLLRGHIRFAIIDALAQGFVSQLICQVRSEFPGITFDIKVLENVDVLTRIVAGDVDFGLMLNPQSSKDILVRAHCDVVLGFITRPDHFFAKRQSCRFNQCVGEPVVAPGDPLAICEQVRVLQAATGINLTVAATCDNIPMIKALVREGVGIGILTSLDVMEEVSRGELAFITISDDMLKPLTLALCVGHARQLSSAANMFLTRLEQELEIS
jgi:DNA-binding transcriptional LysR family regulator